MASIGHADMLFDGSQFIIKFQIFFIKKKLAIDLFQAPITPGKEKETTKKKRKKSYSFSKVRRKAKRILQSFRLEKFYLNIDTDNYYYNAQLYPLLFFAKGKKYQMTINYRGENELFLIIKNRLIRLLFALFF